MEWTTTLPVLGVSAGAGLLAGLGAAWAGSKAFASKWLDHRFASKLETLKLEGQHQLEQVKLQAQNDIERSKQEHTNQIERLKFERSNLLDRSTKINQREFEVIPQIWKTITQAHTNLIAITAAFRFSSNVGSMEAAEFEQFIEESILKDWQKSKIKTLESPFERTSFFDEANYNIKVFETFKSIADMNICMLNNSIFLHPDTYKRLEEFADLLRDSYQEFRLNLQIQKDGVARNVSHESVENYRTNGIHHYESLAAYLRERYWIKPTDNPEPDA